MNRVSLWLLRHNVRIFDIRLEQLHQKSFLRHLMWPLLRIRLKLLYMEIQLRRGKKVYMFHPWLKSEWGASDYPTKGELGSYYANLRRLRHWANEQDGTAGVRDTYRGHRGWLSFSQLPKNEGPKKKPLLPYPYKNL